MSFLFGPPNIEKLKQKRDIGALIKAMKSKDLGVSMEAAAALGDLKAPEATDPLIEMLEEPLGKLECKAAAAKALGKISGASAEQILGRYAESSSAIVQKPLFALALAEGLISIGTETSLNSVNAMRRGNSNPMVRVAVVDLLGKSKNPHAIKPLLSALNDPDPAETLGPSTEPYFHPILNTFRDRFVRQAAVEALAGFGASAMEQLKDWPKGDPRVEIAAGIAMMHIRVQLLGHDEAKNFLLTVSQNEHANDTVRSEARKLLEKLGD
jgi:HEAT repeat protein